MINDQDLEKLTDRELFEVSKSLGIVYKGRSNAIRDIDLELEENKPELPRQLRNLLKAKEIASISTEFYRVTNILSRSTADIKQFMEALHLTSESIPEARCDIVKILVYANKLVQSNMILAMHPNFNEICSKLAGADFWSKLLKLSAELGINIMDYQSLPKSDEILLLEVLNRWPIQEPTDINWAELLNSATPEILSNTFRYFGKLGLFNQLYLYYQLTIEAKPIQPIATVVDWQKLGAKVPLFERPYSMIIPNPGQIIYSASLFAYSQTTLKGTEIGFPGWGCDIEKLGISDFDRASIEKLAQTHLPPVYRDYADIVYGLIAWCFGTSVEIPKVPNSEVALKVIQAASDILRLGKIDINVSYVTD